MSGSHFFDLAARLSPRFTHEQSFSVRARELRTDRFVLTVNVGDIPGNVKGRLIEVCRELEMPPEQIAQVDNNLRSTRVIHLGFEANSGGSLYKIYLEQDVPQPAFAKDPILQHLAFKWRAKDPKRQVLTRYVWYPSYSVAQIRDRVSSMCGAAGYIATELVDLVIGHETGWDVRYLEATEEGNPRRSFDLNLYESGRRLFDVITFLDRLRKHYDIDQEKLSSIVGRDGSQSFGHVTGGTHRNGESFFNVYYGRKPARQVEGNAHSSRI